ncbi:glycoside hydrolase, partial [Blautia pseudococcoides]|nr:glycoside hydrolase [Blautia pseudococcoides]
DNDVVEVTCHVSSEGIRPVAVTEVPPQCDILIRLIKNYERLTVEAVKTGSLSCAARALMLHPLVSSWSLAKELLEDYDGAYAGLLGKE